MGKAEKELRKDVTPLQQNVKRKTQDPGTPSDYAIWSGSTSTKYRWVSSIPAKVGFIILSACSMPAGLFRWERETLKITDSVATDSVNVVRTWYEFRELADQFSFSSLFTFAISFLLGEGTTLKRMGKNIDNSLDLSDEVSTVKT